MRTKRIEVATEHGPYWIDAYAFGFWAAHEGLRGRPGWVVTHVPSGLVVPDINLPKMVAIDAAQILDEVWPMMYAPASWVEGGEILGAIACARGGWE